METIILQQTDPAVLDVATLALEENYNVIALKEIPSNISLLISAHRPDLFILDYVLDGKKALEDLKRIRTLCNTPVVAMSCNAKIAEESVPQGFNGYIKKPFDLDELLGQAAYFIGLITKRSPIGMT